MVYYNEFMHLERLGEGINKNDISREQSIELNKLISRKISDVRAAAKSTQCLYCGATNLPFCNSHTVPEFCLRAIDSEGEGKVNSPNIIMGIPNLGVSISKETLGLNESGTFRRICRPCDSKIFSDYENPDIYPTLQEPTSKMLAEIAMKNYLKFIDKRTFEIELFNQMLASVPFDFFGFSTRKQISEYDLRCYQRNYSKAKKLSQKTQNDGYYLIYYKLLDYVTPIAMQSPIVLATDLEGNTVNYVLNDDPNYSPSDLHLCVFPMKEKTAIILFIDNGANCYRRFYKQFRKLSEDEQLGVISYMIFLYTEDYFLAKELQEKVDLLQFQDVTRLTPNIYSNVRAPQNKYVLLNEQFALLKWKNFPNLLSEQYKLSNDIT